MLHAGSRGSEASHWVKPVTLRRRLINQLLTGILADAERLSSFRSRFLAKTARAGGCLVWTGSRTSLGYGCFYVGTHGGKQLREGAHRVALTMKLGRPVVLEAMHTCDRPWCVLADHLEEGSHRRNQGDKAGRLHSTYGERNAEAKLTEGEVLAIRAAGAGPTELARRYSVSPGQIRRILSLENWRHLPEVTR